MGSWLDDMTVKNMIDAGKQQNNGEHEGGIVFNIHGYSIHDGPGIRTTVFLKGCPLKCYWCHNPESQSKEPEISLNKSKCNLCGRCTEICPSKACGLSEIGSTIERSRCIACGKCAEVCPTGARRLVGNFMTPEMVVSEVLKDVVFYKNSGGGITLSGGEPTAQPEFALAVLKKSKEAGLHTTLDTCGYAPWPVMEKLLEYTDLFLYDIKCLDAKKHRQATGKSNQIILQNAKRIAQFKPIRVRIPLIKGFNDSVQEVLEIGQFAEAELGVTDIDLHPYNELGEIKYEWLNRMCVRVGTINAKHIENLESSLIEVLERKTQHTK